MEKIKNKTTYEPGLLGTLLERIARYFKIELPLLRAVVTKAYPQFKDHTRCPNCDASMAVYWFSIDYLTASLLLEMGRVVHAKVQSGITFHEANKVHVQSLAVASYAIKSRTTWASKLGLITKVMKTDEDGTETHDTRAGWLITKRGFDFLRGEPVPRHVAVFRNKITEREDEKITLQEAIEKDHAFKKGEYNRNDWVDIEKYNQGKML